MATRSDGKIRERHGTLNGKHANGNSRVVAGKKSAEKPPTAVTLQTAGAGAGFQAEPA